MSSKPQPEHGDRLDDSSTGSSRLPFEPAKARRKASKKPSVTSTAAPSATPEKLPAGAINSTAQLTPPATAIPEVVSRRMARRMGFFCGIPTTLGMLTFVVSYVIVSNQWLKLPNVAVVLMSMGFFGLGVLGLSYGVLSASWDEERVGTRLGWQEFTTNFGRLTESWRSTKKT